MSPRARKLLFVDRDGTLIVEPPDQQIDSYEKLALVDGVIPALRRCVAAGYELVMVTNQDGLGTAAFPEAAFEGPQRLLLQILRSQGIGFRDIVIDASLPHEGRDTRKPGTGLVRGYLAADDWSRAASAVIGDRDTDLAFAANLDRFRKTVQPCMAFIFDSAAGLHRLPVCDAAVWVAEFHMLRRCLKRMADRVVIGNDESRRLMPVDQ